MDGRESPRRRDHFTSTENSAFTAIGGTGAAANDHFPYSTNRYPNLGYPSNMLSVGRGFVEDHHVPPHGSYIISPKRPRMDDTSARDAGIGSGLHYSTGIFFIHLLFALPAWSHIDTHFNFVI